MIAGLAALLACQLVGEIVVRALHLPLPGPVGGLALMFAFLLVRGRGQADAVPAQLGRVADTFMANLSVLFIPAAVGVVQYLGLLGHFAWQIALTIVASTILALVATASTFRLASRLYAFRRKPLVQDIEAAIDVEHHP